MERIPFYSGNFSIESSKILLPLRNVPTRAPVEVVVNYVQNARGTRGILATAPDRWPLCQTPVWRLSKTLQAWLRDQVFSSSQSILLLPCIPFTLRCRELQRPWINHKVKLLQKFALKNCQHSPMFIDSRLYSAFWRACSMGNIKIDILAMNQRCTLSPWSI